MDQTAVQNTAEWPAVCAKARLLARCEVASRRPLECKFQMMDCPTATSGGVLLRTPPMGELELLNVADMGSSMFMLPPPIGDMRWEKLAGGVPTAAEAEVSGMGTARGIEARDSGWRKNPRHARAGSRGGGRGGRPRARRGGLGGPVRTPGQRTQTQVRKAQRFGNEVVLSAPESVLQ